MKHILWIFFILVFVPACASPATTLTPPALAAIPETGIPQDTFTTDSATSTVSPATPGTILYISATMHIETKSDSWPANIDAFLTFLEATSNAGMRWSIGADVGWLTNGVRVQEIIQRTSAMGIQWDVHAHEATDRAKTAYLLAQYGVTPTSVVSGMRIDEFDDLSQQLTYQGFTWTPHVIWGGANCVGHRPGCDDTSIALYRPTSTAQYELHDPNGALIRVGNTDHQLITAEQLLSQIVADLYSSVPVLGFTIMVEPEVLQIVNSEDGLAELLAFIERVEWNPAIRFATIEETARAWENAGSIPIQIP